MQHFHSETTQRKSAAQSRAKNAAYVSAVVVFDVLFNDIVIPFTHSTHMKSYDARKGEVPNAVKIGRDTKESALDVVASNITNESCVQRLQSKA